MPRRSILFTPGDRPGMLQKAPESGADVVTFDLEDAVAPERKDEARESVHDVLADPEFDPDCEVCVRVNPVGTVADDDVSALTGDDVRLDSVMLPKAESADDIETLSRLLGEHGVDADVIAIVESAAGVLAAPGIAAADATVAVAFGAEDYSADVGATRTDEGVEVLYARERVVAASAAAGVDAIDTLHTDFEDDEGLRDDAAFSVQLGFDGKLAIHPRQISIINDAFAPAPEDIEWAETVVAAKEAADVEGRGVFRVDGEMIDAPLIKQAERILERTDSDSDRD